MLDRSAGVKPIAITMGDPAGIGPEVIVKSFASGKLPRYGGGLVVVGDARVIARAAESFGIDRQVRAISRLEEADSSDERIQVLDLRNADPSTFKPGEIAEIPGRASMEAVEKAAALTIAGDAAALVTAPINKEATKMAGYPDVGHMEYLARVTETIDYATMLTVGRLRVVHLTTHYSLRRACDLVTRESVLAKLRLTHRSFVAWGYERPRIAAAALNPHGGESGLFGDEEMREIIPAVEAARADGIDARGPYPADSIFVRAIHGEFDAVLAMFHDQGHIPIKVHGFEQSVSVALGLPLVRTSVDHGTAFDIAGKGVADAQGMVASIDVAIQIVSGRWRD